MTSFELEPLDYAAFLSYFVVLCAIGLWAGWKEKSDSGDYFLAGKTLPWNVVGSSFIASNISTEHFIGMIGAAFLFGICVAMSEWLNVLSFSVLIWFFIPFLLASKVFTTPEFMERRFNPTLRQLFAYVTVLSNIVAFLAAVLYGGGLALENLFGWPLWFAVVALGVVAGSWAIYGGLRSVAWTDFFTVIVMIVGGALVTVLGLQMLAGDDGSIVDGWNIMIERNRAQAGVWAEFTNRHAQQIAPGVERYERLSVIQPVTHTVWPWTHLLFGLFSISIWYNVINQFMIQRVLGAKNLYHARMGIVLSGYMKILMPFIVVVPGLILFAMGDPDILALDWGDELKDQADKGYVRMLQDVIPTGLRGLFLAALFGAIQSTVNSVLNSTATVVTLDIYKRQIHRNASERRLVRVGMVSSVVILLLSMVLAVFVGRFNAGLFVYIQTWFAFLAPPFAAVFLLGILFRRINAAGATTAVIAGYALGIAVKVYLARTADAPTWLVPFANQAIINWLFCVVICVVVSLITPPPAPQQVTDQLTFNWRKLNIFDGLGEKWYTHVVLWWGLFVVITTALIVYFSGLFL
jgi:SSS family solute:Na+ symporter